MIEIEITVWQFVRLMVDLEEHAPSGEAYAAWSEAWNELDRRLEELRQRDHESYADLMMNQEVVVAATRFGSSKPPKPWVGWSKPWGRPLPRRRTRPPGTIFCSNRANCRNFRRATRILPQTWRPARIDICFSVAIRFGNLGLLPRSNPRDRGLIV